MKIQFNTDKNIKGTQMLESFVSEEIRRVLKIFVDKITRIEVHISDQNSDKESPNDIQCKIEARLEGMQPVLVVSKSETKEKALYEALDKMKAALGTIVGKIKNK